MHTVPFEQDSINETEHLSHDPLRRRVERVISGLRIIEKYASLSLYKKGQQNDISMYIFTLNMLSRKSVG